MMSITIKDITRIMVVIITSIIIRRVDIIRKDIITRDITRDITARKATMRRDIIITIIKDTRRKVDMMIIIITIIITAKRVDMKITNTGITRRDIDQHNSLAIIFFIYIRL